MKNSNSKKSSYIIVRQIKSGSGISESQKGTLIGLGLRKIGSVSRLLSTKEIAGMIRKVQHLVVTEEVTN